MNAEMQENCNLIFDLDTWEKEISLEGEMQQATISHHVKHRIPLLREKLRRLNEYEREAERIRRTYSLRDVTHEGTGDVHSAGLHLIPD